MRKIRDYLPRGLEPILAFLSLLRFAVGFGFAISPLWGWHPAFGWICWFALAATVWDARAPLIKCMQEGATRGDRVFGFCVFGALLVSFAVNLGLSLS
ncbi:hypothetical protein IP84_10510 [beta proteobacterium AAP99]|nr:hypothetical protein IP84_10510 [beta proteobacterium AAP99]